MSNKMVRTLGFREVFDFNKKIKQARVFVHPSFPCRYFFLEHILQAAGGGEKDE